MKRSRLIAMAAVAGLVACGTQAFGASRDWNVATGNWSTSGNWSPSGSPGALDSVFIGNMVAAQNAVVSLNVNTTVASVALTDGMTLDTLGFSLFSGTSTSVSGFNNTGTGNFATTLRVGQGVGTFSYRTDTLTTSLGGRVDMYGGGELQVDKTFLLQDSTSLSGNGVINLMGNTSPAMTADGDIVAGIGGLTINQLGTGRIDLDGGTAGDKTIAITQSNAGGQAASFTVNGDQLFDAMDDSFQIGGRSTLAMNLTNGWTLGSLASMNFKINSSSVAGAGKLNGSTATFNGDISVDVLADGQINAPVIINNSSTVAMGQNSLLDFEANATINGGNWQIAKFARLSFDGPTAVNGGTFSTFDDNALNGDVTFNGTTTYSGTVTFHGNATQHGNVIVNDTATINADVFNMSGGFPAPQYSITGGLTINADSIDVANGPNAFDGVIVTAPNANNGAGSLTINLPAGKEWQMNNTMILQGPAAGFVDAINGSPMRLNGQTTVSNAVAITARTNFASGSNTSILSNGTFAIDGGTKLDPNTINDGTIGGAGTLLAQSGHALVGHGTLTVAKINFLGDAELRASGGTLAVNGTAIENMGVLGTADASGIVHLKTSYVNPTAGKIEMLGGKMVGSAIANMGTTSGFGAISNDFTNNKALSAVGGELVMDGGIDLDGVVGGVPTINVVGGDLHVTHSPADGFTGIANVGGGRKLTLDSGWILESGGTLNVGGSLVQPGVVSGGNLQAMLGRTNVSFGATFDIQTGFLGGSSVSLPNLSDQLTFAKQTVVNSGVTFTGNGSLRNATGNALGLNNGANVGVYLLNQGKLTVAGDNAVGVVVLKSMSSDATATYASEIGGPLSGTQFDRANVTNGASLDGKLALTTLNNYNPAYLTSHELVHASGNGVSGYFKSISGMPITPTKHWAVTYGANSVYATAARPGDADLNGVINFDDYSRIDFGFNNLLPGWANGDFDGNGAINFDDYALIDVNFNLQAGSMMAAMNWLNGDDRSPGNASQPGVRSVIGHFEQFGSPYAQAFLATNAVPEPSGAVAVIGLIAASGRRRRNRSA